MLRLINRLWRAILDVVYPRYCLECAINLQDTEHFYLCPDCINRMEFINQADTCSRCGIDLGPYVGGQGLCRDCGVLPPRFDRAVAVARYRGVMRDVILKFKYRRDKPLAAPLSDLLAGVAKFLWVDFTPEGNEKTGMILPVPLYRTKLKQRGFNQSELLAARVSNILKISLVTDNLVKIKETPDQAGLDGTARRENLKDAFTVKRPEEIRDKSILLIDDVVTTGTTASEISRMLKRNGARQVFMLSLAHGR